MIYKSKHVGNGIQSNDFKYKTFEIDEKFPLEHDTTCKGTACICPKSNILNLSLVCNMLVVVVVGVLSLEKGKLSTMKP